ncbi:mpv17-like protein isoform X2 [Marmota monax]|uniref:mpv17-like protein isoform X2 n=1 Tax=Marmota monax TaxID=9995 RepID=UPI001EB02913|nr:mpv17-like protein isoform X2 [Marmota monax]
MVAGAAARGPALPVAHQRPALRRALLGRRRAPAAAAGRPGRLAPDAARGHPGRDLPRQLQLRVAAPAGARAARPRAARGPDQGMSILQEKDDVLLDLKQKFWNTYKTGLMYWPFVQLTNFGLVPVHWRTAYTGLCGFLWATFLCFSQQSGDGTLQSAFAFLHRKEADVGGRRPGK